MRWIDTDAGFATILGLGSVSLGIAIFFTSGWIGLGVYSLALLALLGWAWI